jgi:membrane protease YdiL (CAAX protease family)
MKNPLFENSHPVFKLLFLFAIYFVTLIFFGVIFISLDYDDITTKKIFNGLSTIGVFLIPALLAGYIFSSTPKKYLHLNNTKAYMFIFAGIIIFFAIPLINYTGMLNSKLAFPESMSGFEETIQKLEAEAEKTTKEFLTVSTASGLLLNLLIIAVIPAIGEELFFRGILLNLFKDWTKNIHIAIIITSVLFSAVHMQFYGFLPRMLLGMLFAYLLIWSGSMWIPVVAHFINNAIAVIVFYFMKDPELFEKADKFGADKSTYIYLIFSTIVLGVFLYFFRKAGKDRKITYSEV